jgi:hypothetical protein
MAKPTGKVLIQLELKPETAMEIAKAVQVEGMTDISKISSVVTGLAEQLAEGGIMLEVGDVERLRATGRDIDDAGDIVEMAETGVGFRKGQFTFAADIDPELLTPLKEYAAQCGVTLDELGTQTINYAIDQGWVWETPYRYRAIRLDEEHNKAIAEMTSLPLDFSGAQLAKWMREQILGIVEEEPPVSLEPEEVQP